MVRLRSPKRLVLVFAVTILLPALLLGFFGLRALLWERELADRDIRQRLETAAKDAELGLQEQLLEWRRIAGSAAADADNWPARLRAAVSEPGQAVVLREANGRVRAFPANQIPYALGGVEAAPAPRGPLWREAEVAELRQKEYERALRLYRQLLDRVNVAEKPLVLHRIARCARKAGREEEAVSWFRKLARAPSVRIGPFPSDLLARQEIVASAVEQLDLYKDLVAGRWDLDKSSYYFYASSARERLGTAEEAARWREIETRKLALGRAAERFLEKPHALVAENGSYCLAFWRQEPFTAILLSGRFARSELLPRAFRDSGGRELEISLATLDGDLLFGAAPPDDETVVTRAVGAAGLPLQLRTWPRDSSALYENANRRRNLYLGMLAGVVALLIFGGYLTLRAVRAEMAMAQLKSDFVSTVSHEFRSPLTGIHQLAEMLQDGRVKEEGRRRQYYAMIVSETRRLRRLVENVLDFSRIEEGRKKYDFEPFEPSPWLRELAGEFSREVAADGFTVETDIAHDLPMLSGDREALGTAIRNLLDNAVKYSGDSRTVWLASSANGRGLSITVRDEGGGVAIQDRERIFERFYRGGTHRDGVKGVGLGLNLVQSIVAAHGGTVEVESSPGEGSLFTIHLRAEET